jgi:hypothetical protein
MNSESQIPQLSPESDGDCGVSPQAEQGASRSESTAQETEKDSSNLLTPLITDHRSLGTSPSQPYDDMGFVYPPETCAEPDYDGDSDYEESARERELVLDDLADYNDDFSRSNDEGWFYSDEY